MRVSTTHEVYLLVDQVQHSLHLVINIRLLFYHEVIATILNSSVVPYTLVIDVARQLFDRALFYYNRLLDYVRTWVWSNRKK